MTIISEPLPRHTSKLDPLRCWISSAGSNAPDRANEIKARAAIEVPDGWETRLVRSLDGQ